MGLQDFAQKLKETTARAREVSTITERLRSFYPELAAPAKTQSRDDVFEKMRLQILNAIEQAWYPIFYLGHTLNSGEGRQIINGEHTEMTAKEYGDNVFVKATKGDYTQAIINKNGKVEMHFDPTKDSPFQISFPTEHTAKMKLFQHLLEKLKIKFNPADIRVKETMTEYGIRKDTTKIRLLSSTMSVDEYEKMDMEWEPSREVNEDDDGAFYMQPGVDQGFDELTKETGIGFRHRFAVRDLTNNGWYISGNLHVSFVVIVPEDFFHWMNGTLGTASRAPKFPFSLARDFSRLMVKGYGQLVDWDNLEIVTPNKIKKRLDLYTAGVPGFQPRVNSRGWAVGPVGDLFKPSGIDGKQKQRHGELMIERQERLDAVLSEISNLTMTADLNDPEQYAKLTELQNTVPAIDKEYNGRIMVVDWINDKMFRLTSDGKETIEDLVGTRALDPVTEYSILNKSINDDRFVKSIGALIGKIDAFRNDRWRKERMNGNFEREAPNGVAYDHIRLAGDWASYPAIKNLPLKCLAGIDLEEEIDETVPEPTRTNAIKACQRIAEAFKDVWLSLDDFFKDYGETNTTGDYGYLTEMAATLTPEVYEQVRQGWRAEVAKTRNSHVLTTMPIPNINIRPGKFEAIQPHQADAFGTLLNHPKHALIDISAGGGKTIIGIIDAITTIRDMKISRPLIVTAGNLVPDFITEINALTNGKMNAVPLRPDVMSQAISDMNMKSVSDVIRWLKSYPKNTIFVSAHTDFTSRRVFFEDFDVPIAYGTLRMNTFQFRQIMAAVGFEYVMVDESQFIKNPSSNRTMGVTYMLSRAEYTRPASGTMLNNTVMDIYGQVRAAVNGAVFGSLSEFETNFASAIMSGTAAGERSSSKAGAKLRDHIRGHAAMITKRKSDWAFLMPDIQPEFIYCKMTERQTDYYNRLMTEAEMEIRRELERLKSDTEGDSIEIVEARIQSMLQHRLQTVEQFLVAPDLNKDYTNPEDGDGSADEEGNPLPKPTGADLISPEVLAADLRIDIHLASKRTDKIIVFGYHRAASAHFMRHSRHAGKFLRYTAGNLDIIRKFKEGPSIGMIAEDKASFDELIAAEVFTNVGLCADMNSMKQGHNLQIAGRVIMLQSLWAPGDYEQAISRMYRPDPRGVYNREFVNLDWVLPLTNMGEATLAVAKASRMISKAIANAQVSNADDYEWMRIAPTFEDVGSLSMDLELVFDFKMNDAEPYLKSWNRMSQYEAGAMKRVRKAVGEKLEAQHNVTLLDADGRVLDVREFLKYAMVDVTPDNDIEGSRRVYTPWIENAEPADPYDLGLELVGETVIPTETFVMTEFGPGQVKALRYNKTGSLTSLRVQTAVGVQTLPTTTVAYTIEENANKELRRMFNNMNKYALIPAGMKADPRLISPTVGKKMTDEEVERPRIVVKKPNIQPKGQQVEETPQDEGDGEFQNGFGGTIEAIELRAGVINGMPMLYVKEDIEWVGEISPEWQWVDEFAAVDFSNWQAASTFLDKLGEKFFINQAHFNRLRAGLEDMRRGKSVRADTFPNPTLIRNFFLESKRRLGKAQDGTPIAKPFWITNGTDVRLAFDLSSHDPVVRRWLVQSGRSISGVRKITQNSGMWVNFFRTPKEAATDAKAVVAFLKKNKVKVDIGIVNEELKKANEIFALLKRNTSAQDD